MRLVVTAGFGAALTAIAVTPTQNKAKQFADAFLLGLNVVVTIGAVNTPLLRMMGNE